MRRYPNCSIEAKQKVVSLYLKGYSLFSISEATSVQKSTCWDIGRKYTSRGHVKNRKSPSRPKNLDSKEKKRLINLSQNDPKKNSTQLFWHLNPKKSCSPSLIRRILISYYLSARIAIKKLTARNRLARKVWAKEHALLPKIFLQYVLFSDETTLELHSNEKVLVRRLPNTGMEKKNLSETQKFGGKKLMLWGFIAHDGRKCLQKVCGTINSIKYLQILQENLLPEMFLGEKLQQDNGPAHNSILSKTWFSENGLEVLESWPPNSPDINISLECAKRVFQRHPKNFEELWVFCQEEFERIPLEYIQNLYSSIPDRLNKFVHCNGKTLNFEFFVVSFNGFCIYFLLELLLQEILLIVRNFSHSRESGSYITLVYVLSIYKILKSIKART